MKRQKDTRYDWLVTTQTGFRSFVKPSLAVIEAGKTGNQVRAYISDGCWQLAPLICNAPSLSRVRVQHLDDVLKETAE